MTPTHYRASWGNRSGFSLIEILVVLAIIGILITLLASAAVTVVNGQRVRNTEVTIRKLYGIFMQHYKSVIDDAQQEPMPNAVRTLAETNVQDPVRARAIYTKLRLKQEFPTSFKEVFHPFQDPGGTSINDQIAGEAALQPKEAYVRYLNQANINACLTPANLNQPGFYSWPPNISESSACLLMALTTRGRRGGRLDADILGTLEVGDYDGDGVREILDSWGSPLRFFRFPYGNSGDIAAYANQNQYLDPQDPTRSLGYQGQESDGTNDWNTYANRNNVMLFETLLDYPVGTIGTGMSAATWSRYSFYMIPVIASPGRDAVVPSSKSKCWGMVTYANNTPHQSMSPLPGTDPKSAYANDNIYSYRLVR